MIDRIVEAVTKELQRHASGENKKDSKETAVGSAIRDFGRNIQLANLAVRGRRKSPGTRATDNDQDADEPPATQTKTDSGDRRSNQRRARPRRRTWTAAERIVRRATGTIGGGTVSGGQVKKAVKAATPQQKRQMKIEYDKTTKITKGWKKKKKKDGRAGRDGDGDGKKNEK
jgi:hypothetical protein